MSILTKSITYKQSSGKSGKEIIRKQKCGSRVKKILIALAGNSGYNGFKVIYLLGMAVEFASDTKGGCLWIRN